MLVNRIIQEDFSNYKKPSLFIGMPYCDGKCWRDLNLSPTLCQNHELFDAEIFSVNIGDLCKQYIDNPITKAIVFGGLEPFHDDSFLHMLFFIEKLRVLYKCNDDVVIYTGYYPTEITGKVKQLENYDNIIIKYGRYVPNKPSIYDDVLGVELASNNQWAEKVIKWDIRRK